MIDFLHTMIPPPYPVLIYLMLVSFVLGMLFYRTVHILVMRSVRRKEKIR